VARILATGAAFTGTGAMVATMALDARAGASDTSVVLEPVPAPSAAGTAAPAPAAPPVVVVIRRVPVASGASGSGSTSGTVLRSGDRPVPAPPRSASSHSSTRSSGS
jgi:hypothetical protein